MDPDTAQRLTALEDQVRRLDLSLKLVVASTRAVFADEVRQRLGPVTREAPEKIAAG